MGWNEIPSISICEFKWSDFFSQSQDLTDLNLSAVAPPVAIGAKEEVLLNLSALRRNLVSNSTLSSIIIRGQNSIPFQSCLYPDPSFNVVPLINLISISGWFGNH